MSKTDKGHWVFRVYLVDRAGALTSIASAFSNENISIDTVVGHGVEERAGVNGSVVVTFHSSQDEKDIMARKIRRLSKVIRMEERPYESQNLRKSAIIQTNRRLKPRDVAGEESFLTSELVTTNPMGWTYFLAGSPNELDRVLSQLEQEGIMNDMVYSVISL